MKKYKYEIRGIDAWAEGDEEGCGWTWNESWHIAYFETNAKDVGKAFRRFLQEHCGIKFCPHQTFADGFDIIEICNRKTKEPYVAAIPMF